jgi:hypothetical protein
VTPTTSGSRQVQRWSSCTLQAHVRDALMDGPVRRSDLVSISAKVLQSAGDGTNWTRYKRLESTCSRKTLLPRLMNLREKNSPSMSLSAELCDLDGFGFKVPCVLGDKIRPGQGTIYFHGPFPVMHHPVRPTCLIDPRKGCSASRIRAVTRDAIRELPTAIAPHNCTIPQLQPTT